MWDVSKRPILRFPSNFNEPCGIVRLIRIVSVLADELIDTEQLPHQKCRSGVVESPMRSLSTSRVLGILASAADIRRKIEFWRLFRLCIGEGERGGVVIVGDDLGDGCGDGLKNGFGVAELMFRSGL